MTKALRWFIANEAAGGVLLMGAALIALVVVNVGAAAPYEALWATRFSIEIGDRGLSKPLTLWVNDGLMALFFLLVGLELKREILAGELSSAKNASLPIFAAVGGVVLPAVVYLAVVPEGAAQRGWAIPVATDIAFALGILLFLGPRIPPALKVFLTGAVIVDDLVAIAIIALFYSGALDLSALAWAAVLFAALLMIGRARVESLVAYVALGAALWLAVLASGLHATLAGVLLAAAVPMTSRTETRDSPLERLEHGLHPWVAFGVLPVFALANAGVVLSSAAGGAGGVTIGVMVGLILGKPAGVLGFSWLAVRSGLAQLPARTSWSQLAGVALLCGVGFTMSLFIGALAFGTPELIEAAKVGIVGGSLVSAIAGVFVLLLASPAGFAPDDAPAPKPDRRDPGIGTSPPSTSPPGLS